MKQIRDSLIRRLLIVMNKTIIPNGVLILGLGSLEEEKLKFLVDNILLDIENLKNNLKQSFEK
jgi:hypothetical protein